MSKFGKAFNDARAAKKSVFDFGGKKYNTKLKSATPVSAVKGAAGNSGPKTTAALPKSRASAVSGMAKSKPSFSGLSNVASSGFKPSSGPSKRGGGPKIAMSQANMDKKKAFAGAKASTGPSFKGAMKRVSNSIKMGY